MSRRHKDDCDHRERVRVLPAREKGVFENIIDLIIILIVLQFLCSCVLGTDDC
ncbi:MAG: hypothetical protein ACOYI2_08460 [Bacillota bacterium]|jgi:hypothetical protein